MSTNKVFVSLLPLLLAGALSAEQHISTPPPIDILSANAQPLYLALNEESKNTKSQNKDTKKSSNNSHTSKSNDRAFLGPQIGFGGLGTINAGIIGGYMHYFGKDMQLEKFRHGIRGIGSANYYNYSYSYWGGKYSYNGVYVQAGADYFIEFTPNQKTIWGLYTGLSLGYYYISSNDWWYTGASAIGWGWNGGGFAMIDRKHRFELALDSGFSAFALRYMYMF